MALDQDFVIVKDLPSLNRYGQYHYNETAENISQIYPGQTDFSDPDIDHLYSVIDYESADSKRNYQNAAWPFLDIQIELNDVYMENIHDRRLVNRKNRVAATDEFVLKDRDYTKDDDIMIGVW